VKFKKLGFSASLNLELTFKHDIFIYKKKHAKIKPTKIKHAENIPDKQKLQFNFCRFIFHMFVLHV